ncbi:MAG: SufD family Fe-S cluster assembly protein [Desulfurococcales archaeon]|nr:SufD family Fe-S cluster assembly protein [Desulfurococcales archaeon]
MSSVKSEGLDKPLTNLRISELRLLANTIPVQKYGDSPTIKHYTDWSKLLKIKEAERALRSTKGVLEDILEPSLVLEPEDIVVNSSSSVYVSTLKNSGDFIWKIPVENKLQAIHSYKWYQGASIRLSGEQEVSIYLSPGEGYVGYHLEIDIEPNSRVNITLIVDNSSESSLHSSSTLINVGSNSQVSISTLEKSKGATYHYKYVRMENNSRVESRILASGGEATRFREDYVLEGSKASTVIRGSSISKVNEKLDLIINTIHRAPGTISGLKTRGMVSGVSTVAHRGVARVYKSAEWSSVDVESFLYITTDKARAYSVPVLEVDTGIVESARHSTAVMDIPSEIEFYLRQRGFSKSDIIRLISIGLLEIVASDLKLEKLEKIYL